MISLSATEQAQLGSTRLRQDGAPSAHPYPSAELWPQIRAYLLERSQRSNPLLDPELCAYTPGETRALLEHPEIKAWQRGAVGALAGDYKTVVLVPCAKTKPWVGPAVAKSKLYSAYNVLRGEHPEICFATVSEPLGIVPMQSWASFPQYDNPGLFRDDAQQSGMTKSDWQASPFGRWYGLPFDENAWRQSIEVLGAVVGRFLAANQDKRLLSVLDNGSGPQSTHGAMLDVALRETGLLVERYPKRLEARVSPLPYLREVLAGRASDARLDSALTRPRLSQLEQSATAAVANADAELALS